MAIKVKLEPQIELRNLELSSNGYPSDFIQNEISKGTPYISYSGELNIDFSDVISVRLNNDKFLPTIEIIFRDKTNKIFDPIYPMDNDIVSIFIKSQSEDYWPIRMDFKILQFNIDKSSPGEKNDMKYKIIGSLDVDYLYYRKSWAKKGTSYEVLKQISKDALLGFASNMDDTNDLMTWINANDTFVELIKKITSHSYKSTETFLFSYVDFYYRLNYVDIETQLQEDVSNVLVSTNYNNTALNVTDKKSNQKVKLKLSNHPDFKSSNMYISKFNIDNSSTETNIKNGYKVVNQYYDKTENRYVFKKLDSISDVGDGTQIVLKDRPGVNTNLTQNCYTSEYVGKLDRDNTHPNYLFAYSQNKLNLDFLQKIKMVVVLNQPNYALYRFQKVPVEIYKLSEVDVDENAPIDNSNKINQRLSGDWLITAINYVYSKDRGTEQYITLIKRELTSNYGDRK